MFGFCTLTLEIKLIMSDSNKEKRGKEVKNKEQLSNENKNGLESSFSLLQCDNNLSSTYSCLESMGMGDLTYCHTKELAITR